jgi:hypothetical protein
MGLCKDPRLTYLNDRGYSVVRLPRQGIVPLGIIGRDHTIKNWLGSLDQIWRSEVPVPAVSAPQVVGAINGQKTSDIKLSLGLEILGNALNGMFRSTAPSLELAYKDAKSIQFAFREVKSLSIDPFAIGNYLSKGDLANANVFVKKYFSGQKDVDALIITEVLQAKSIGVVGKKDTSTAVTVSVPAIQATLGAKVGVTAANATSTEVTYEGPEYLTFGFKVFGIGMLNGEWQIHGVRADEGTAFAVDDPFKHPIVSEDELVDIDYSMSPAR